MEMLSEMFYGLAFWLLLLSRQWSICSTQTIVSTGKSAGQISTYYSDGVSYSADLAVDGNTANNFESGSCSRTLQAVNPWWYVDLGDIYTVDSVLIYNADGFEERLVGTEVRVSSDSSSLFSGTVNNQCGSTITSAMTTSNFYTINCNPSMNGQYVALYRNDVSNVMEFIVCEVAVYGVLERPVVTCPDDIVVGTSPGLSTATVTWIEPTVTDNIDSDLSATCSPSSGASYNVGMHTVMCSSTDSGSNTGSCMFTVHVTAIVSTGKSAFQSSTYDSGVSYSAHLAVDGNTATNFESDSCSRTLQEVNPWWFVNLGEIYSIDFVLIYKADGFEESLVGTEVRVTSDTSSLFSGTVNNQCGSTITSAMTTSNYYTIDCNPSINGQYVMLSRSGSSNIEYNVCEVQVVQVINSCGSAPCLNGGTCANIETAYSCTCTSSYTGTQCETPIVVSNPCDSTPCLNGGTCNNLVTAYSCICTSSYTGTQCDMPVVVSLPCDSAPCFNGGTCINIVTAFICSCTSSYTGRQCETFVDIQDPTITCGMNVSQSTDLNSSKATVFYDNPVTSDNVGVVSVNCNPQSGSQFDVGINSVQCTATDAAGNTADCSLNIIVTDAESPTVTCPGDINENTASNQATVTWSETVTVVTDNVDTGLSANCTPSSGSSFNVGETDVTCSASDIAGNEDSCMFVVKVFVGNTDKMSDGEDSNTTLTVVVALIVALVLLLVAIVLVWRIRAKRRIIKSPERITFSASKGISGNGLEQQINEPLTPDVHSPQEDDAKNTPDPYVNQEIRTPAIPVQDLPEYVRVKKAAGELAGEWELLPEGVENKGRASAAFETSNTTKNRYRNVVPYDEHRVVLEKVNDDPFSDYINACFIKGFTSEKAYIAAQGPNKTTVADFWRMIWQENVCTIVMTTNLVEDGKNKCIKYWPEEANRYGDIMVSSYEVVSKTSFIIRKLKMVMGKEVKFVKQYHFLVWPDKNIPRSSSPVITLLKVIQNENPPNAGPIVVHCSAGAGRTGAIIAIDAMMSMAQETGEVNVFEFVKEMRKRRPNMVQTPLQYEFVYDTLLEFVVFGETSCAVSDFKDRYKKLRDINPKSKKSYLSEEFEALQSISSTIRASTKGGLRPENRDKNRYPDIIPYDRNRPFIMTPGENGPSDYINASFFDSFDKKDMFLGTQAPMENTVEDFWRMVADYNSRAIVVLNDLHNRDKTVAQFWPGNSLKLTFKHLTVSSSTSEHLSKQIKVHTVDVMKTDESGSLKVRIFEYLGWPADSYTPTSSKEFLQLVTVVNKWQSEIGDPTVVVMCMEGLGRTGVFCATMSSLRRLTEEQTVDIVQGVKLLRNNRPGMVQTLSQYEFIYKTVLEHLLAFEVYDNVPQDGEEALYANV